MKLNKGDLVSCAESALGIVLDIKYDITHRADYAIIYFQNLGYTQERYISILTIINKSEDNNEER